MTLETDVAAEAPRPERSHGELWWFGEPVFGADMWLDGGLWHLEVLELGLEASAPTQEAAAGAVGELILDRLFFLSDLAPGDLSEAERRQRALILDRVGPLFVKHRERQRRGGAARRGVRRGGLRRRRRDGRWAVSLAAAAPADAPVEAPGA